MLTVSDLRVSYGMSEVIHGINLEVGENETVAIMGRNGMGKTTLFKSLIGMIPCSGGEITFNDKKLLPAGGERHSLRTPGAYGVSFPDSRRKHHGRFRSDGSS